MFLTRMTQIEGVKMDAAILIPIKGAKVRDPKTMNYLLEDGELKPLIGPEGRYWRRRIKDRSVMIKPEIKTRKSVVKEEKEK